MLTALRKLGLIIIITKTLVKQQQSIWRKQNFYIGISVWLLMSGYCISFSEILELCCLVLTSFKEG